MALSLKILANAALFARGLTVGRDMTGDGANATGEVSLSGANIGGQLTLDGASFTNPDGMSLDAEGITVGQDMRCRAGFTARGEVNLQNAKIAGGLSRTRESHATDCEGLMTVGAMLCKDGFTADGEVSLLGAQSAAS